MPRPDPLLVPWRGRLVRVHHDDPRLTPHSPRAAVVIAAAQLAGTADGLRRVLQATVGEWYAVAVRDEPLAVGLRRLPIPRGPPGYRRRAAITGAMRPRKAGSAPPVATASASSRCSAASVAAYAGRPARFVSSHGSPCSPRCQAQQGPPDASYSSRSPVAYSA